MLNENGQERHVEDHWPDQPSEFSISDEHTAVALMGLDDLNLETIPPGYLRSIETVADQRREG